METGFTSKQVTNEKTWEEIEAGMVAELEAEERRKAEELEKMQKMTTAEYVAYRSGKPMPLSNEELAPLSMGEYIKARRG